MMRRGPPSNGNGHIVGGHCYVGIADTLQVRKVPSDTLVMLQGGPMGKTEKGPGGERSRTTRNPAPYPTGKSPGPSCRRPVVLLGWPLCWGLGPVPCWWPVGSSLAG